MVEGLTIIASKVLICCSITYFQKIKQYVKRNLIHSYDDDGHCHNSYQSQIYIGAPEELQDKLYLLCYLVCYVPY